MCAQAQRKEKSCRCSASLIAVPSLFSCVHRRARWTSRLPLQYSGLQNDDRDQARAKRRSHSLFQVVRHLQKWTPSGRLCKFPQSRWKQQKDTALQRRKTIDEACTLQMPWGRVSLFDEGPIQSMLQPKTKESRAYTKDRHNKIHRPITQKPVA